MTALKLTVINNADDLRLSGSLEAGHLIVHLGRPGPTVEVGEHELTWDQIEYVGSGHFTVTRNGKKYFQVTQEAPPRTPLV